LEGGFSSESRRFGPCKSAAGASRLLLSFAVAFGPARLHSALHDLLPMSPTERILAQIGLGVAVIGAVLGLFILFASGMSNVADSARRQIFMAFPAPSLGVALSVFALALGCRRGTLRTFAPTVLWAVFISGGTILLAIAALRTYR
jgi:hypothetical protein